MPHATIFEIEDPQYKDAPKWVHSYFCFRVTLHFHGGERWGLTKSLRLCKSEGNAHTNGYFVPLRLRALLNETCTIDGWFFFGRAGTPFISKISLLNNMLMQGYRTSN